MNDIDIVNIALGWLGCDRIADFGEDSPEARWAKDNYGPLRDTVLSDRKWSFCTRREQLAQDASSPVFQYTYRHVLPSLIVKVWNCFDVNQDEIDDWIREGQSVVSNEATVYAITTFRCSEAFFSPQFAQALAARLAGAGAIPLTENRQLMTDYMGLYDTLLKTAAASDGQQGRSEQKRGIRLPGRRPTI